MTDSCPACCARGVQPVATRRRGQRIAHGYRCPCGRQWVTVRDLTAYPTTARREEAA